MEALERERQAYERHVKQVAKRLAAAQAAAVAAGSDQEQRQQQQAQGAGGEGEAAEGAALAGSAADGQLDSGVEAAAASSSDPWATQVDWEELREQGRQQGWLVGSEEVFLGEKIGQVGAHGLAD